MRLAELVAGAASSPQALARARAARRGDGQAGRRGAGRAGLPGEPLQPAVRARGDADRAGAARHARAGRPHLPPRLRLPDGPVRADGPRRHRRRRAIAASFHAQTQSPAGGRRRSPRSSLRAGATGARRARAGTPTRRARPPTRRRPSRAAAPGGSWSSRARTRSPHRLLDRGGGRGLGRADAVGGRRRGAVPDRRLRPRRGRPPLQGGPQVLLCDAAPLSAQDPGGSAAGFALPLPVRDGGLVELTRAPTTAPGGRRRGRGVLRDARPPRGVGRRRAGARRRADRRPARQRGVLRARRGRRPRRGHRLGAWSWASTTRAARSRGAT